MITNAQLNRTTAPLNARAGSRRRVPSYSAASDQGCRKPKARKSFSSRYDEVLQYVPLIRAIALSMYAKLEGSPNLEDLITAGIFGMFDATGEFDPSSDVPFMSFAKSRIRGAMLTHLLGVPTASRKEGR